MQISAKQKERQEKTEKLKHIVGRVQEKSDNQLGTHIL